MLKDKYLKAFMKMAEVFAETSEAVRLKVGCLLIKDGNIISHGVNGMPPGWPTEVCEDIVYAKDEKPWLFDGSQEVGEDVVNWLDTIYPYKGAYGIYRLVTKPECRHAEVAALEKMWHSHTTTEGSILVVTHQPCFPCSLKIKTAGITHVYYKHKYRCDLGLCYLVDHDIVVTQID